MVTELFVPDRRIVVPKPPSYVKLDMAFAIGAGAKLMDKSRYRSHGTISGATWTDGAHGKALDFDPATPSYVEIPAAHTQLNFIAESFTIIMRVYFGSVAHYNWLYARGKHDSEGYYIRTTPAGRIDFFTSQSGGDQNTYSGNGEVISGRYYTLGLSRDGAAATLYKNGVALAITAATHINPATCAKVALIGGRDELDTYFLEGKIEFLRIFGGVALTLSEHLAWHNALA